MRVLERCSLQGVELPHHIQLPLSVDTDLIAALWAENVTKHFPSKMTKHLRGAKEWQELQTTSWFLGKTSEEDDRNMHGMLKTMPRYSPEIEP